MCKMKLILWFSLISIATVIAQYEERAYDISNSTESGQTDKSTEEPSTGEPSTADDPITDEPSTAEPITDKSSTIEPTTENSNTDEPVTDEPTTEKSNTDEPSTEKPNTDEPSTADPTTEEPTTQDPTTTIPTTTALPTSSITDSKPFLLWSPKEETFEAIEADNGYKIGVVVEECDLQTQNGDYVSLSSSEEMDTNDTVWFVYTQTGKPSFLFNTNRVYVYFKGDQKSKFTANFTRIGVQLTTVTTEEPTTVYPLPTQAANETDGDRISVYLGGKLSEDYKNETVQMLLKEIIANMTTEYCSEQNFNLAENITTTNVLIHSINVCSATWPNSATCALLTFGVAIELYPDPNATWTGYQLDAKHLRRMWDTLSGKYLKDGGLVNFQPPEEDQYLKWQIVLFASVTVLFIICLVLVRFFAEKISKSMRRRGSDTTSIISEENRNSTNSLNAMSQHYLQDRGPEIFTEPPYRMYDPQEDSPYRSTHFEYPEYTDYHEVRGEGRTVEFDADLGRVPESGA